MSRRNNQWTLKQINRNFPVQRIEFKRWKKNEQDLRDLWDNMKQANRSVIGIAEVGGRKDV